MGIQIKHVVVVSVIFALVGFVYVMVFSTLDPRWPRAGARHARPSLNRLVSNVRAGMISGQPAGARESGDKLIEEYPRHLQAWLYRAYSYRTWQGDFKDGAYTPSVAVGEELASWEAMDQLFEEWDSDAVQGVQLRSGLYLRGWSLRGLGRLEESRVDFARLAELYSEVSGIESSRVVDEEAPADVAYNLACYWSVAGEHELAIGYWKVSVDGGYLTSRDTRGWWRVDPDFEDLWNDERFWQIGGAEGYRR